jgi:hypothetical protein
VRLSQLLGERAVRADQGRQLPDEERCFTHLRTGETTADPNHGDERDFRIASQHRLQCRRAVRGRILDQRGGEGKGPPFLPERNR